VQRVSGKGQSRHLQLNATAWQSSRRLPHCHSLPRLARRPLSTGGFTKEAKYEGDRSNSPATLIDLDELARLVVTHYDNFDLEGRTLIPLVKVFWPAE
jgi:hypothetical protein